jgi:phospholipase/carboxylesterase
MATHTGAWVIGLSTSLLLAVGTVSAVDELPRRISPVPATTNSVPHVQLDVELQPELAQTLLKRAAAIKGVTVRGTVISLPGAKGFWIDDSVTIERPERIVGGREFAHMHPDGSLHASLPPNLAIEAVQRGWATFHPWSTQRPGWDGFVMIYTPQSPGELDVVMELVQASYDFVTAAKQ